MWEWIGKVWKWGESCTSPGEVGVLCELKPSEADLMGVRILRESDNAGVIGACFRGGDPPMRRIRRNNKWPLTKVSVGKNMFLRYK